MRTNQRLGRNLGLMPDLNYNEKLSNFPNPKLVDSTVDGLPKYVGHFRESADPKWPFRKLVNSQTTLHLGSRLMHLRNAHLRSLPTHQMSIREVRTVGQPLHFWSWITLMAKLRNRPTSMNSEKSRFAYIKAPIRHLYIDSPIGYYQFA